LEEAEGTVMEQEEIQKLKTENKALLEMCKRSYRKIALDDREIGWEELTKELSGILLDVMGDMGFLKWMDEVRPEDKI
jgi:hypothetical protein